MVDAVNLSVDAVVLALSLGVSSFALAVRGRFAGGEMRRPWNFIGLSPLLLALGKLMMVLMDFYGEAPPLAYLELVFEAGFLAALGYGLYLFYRFWTPRRPQPGRA